VNLGHPGRQEHAIANPGATVTRTVVTDRP